MNAFCRIFYSQGLFRMRKLSPNRQETSKRSPPSWILRSILLSLFYWPTPFIICLCTYIIFKQKSVVFLPIDRWKRIWVPYIICKYYFYHIDLHGHSVLSAKYVSTFGGLGKLTQVSCFGFCQFSKQPVTPSWDVLPMGLNQTWCDWFCFRFAYRLYWNKEHRNVVSLTLCFHFRNWAETKIIIFYFINTLWRIILIFLCMLFFFKHVSMIKDFGKDHKLN